MPDEPTVEEPATGDPEPSTPPASPPPAAPQPDPPAMGDAGKRAIEAERAARKALERELNELRPLAEEARKAAEGRKTAEEKLTEKLTALTGRATSAELQLAQLRAAMASAPAGMDFADIEELAGRLRGTTPEELAADATALFGRLAPPAPPPTPPAGPGQRPVEQLRSGARPASGEPSLAEQIVAAEKSGDHAAAMRLKSAQLFQRLPADNTT